MDFKAALQAEIEAKKRQLSKAVNKSEEFSETKRFSVKVSDLEKQKQEEYTAKQKALEQQRQVLSMDV